MIKTANNLRSRCQLLTEIFQSRTLKNTVRGKIHGSQQTAYQSKKSQGSSPFSYKRTVEMRRRQARQSVLIRHYGGSDCYQSVLRRCEEYGAVKSAYNLCCVSPDDRLVKVHYGLVEFHQPESVDRLSADSREFENPRSLPVQGKKLFLWYHPDKRNAKPRGRAQTPYSKTNREVQLDSELDNSHLSDISLSSRGTLQSSIEQLYSKQKMGEVGHRIRYLTCAHLEDSLRGILPHATIQQFGSSASGFARHNSDLDMALSVGIPEDYQQRHEDSVAGDLYHITKSYDDGRPLQQRLLRAVTGLVSSIIPGYTGVRPILTARVPIVKFTQQVLGLECDLCISNAAGVYMSELLYNLGELDWRLRPLVFAVRHWAQLKEVTSLQPGGPHLTNFMLTLMMIHYLQTRKPGILPSVSLMRDLADPEDKKCIDGEDCSFTCELAKIPTSQNTQQLDDLFSGFMEYFASFDFSVSGISLVEGSMVKNASEEPFYLENPLQQDLNVSKNVTAEGLEHFQRCCTETARALGGPRSHVRLCSISGLMVDDNSMDHQQHTLCQEHVADTRS